MGTAWPPTKTPIAIAITLPVSAKWSPKAALSALLTVLAMRLGGLPSSTPSGNWRSIIAAAPRTPSVPCRMAAYRRRQSRHGAAGRPPPACNERHLRQRRRICRRSPMHLLDPAGGFPDRVPGGVAVAGVHWRHWRRWQRCCRRLVSRAGPCLWISSCPLPQWQSAAIVAAAVVARVMTSGRLPVAQPVGQRRCRHCRA